MPSVSGMLPLSSVFIRQSSYRQKKQMKDQNVVNKVSEVMDSMQDSYILKTSQARIFDLMQLSLRLYGVHDLFFFKLYLILYNIIKSNKKKKSTHCFYITNLSLRGNIAIRFYLICFHGRHKGENLLQRCVMEKGSKAFTKCWWTEGTPSRDH